MPPTEKRGRVHTSTITVAVINQDIATDKKLSQIHDSDFRVEWFGGTGAGGQHRNKSRNCCRLYHVPTGMIESQQGRKRDSNFRTAKQRILQRLEEMKVQGHLSTVSDIRKNQVGSGDRNDKIRTYRFKDNVVIDHVTNKSAKCSKVFRGHFNLLWQ